jgi:hypothetical protein
LTSEESLPASSAPAATEDGRSGSASASSLDGDPARGPNPATGGSSHPPPGSSGPNGAEHPPPADPDAALRGILIKAAGGVAVGIGIIGFVVLVGGAYFWARFSSSGLPADEAVADLSHSQLLVVGTRELALWVGIILAELVLLYLLEQRVQGGYGIAGHLQRPEKKRADKGTPEWHRYIFQVRAGMVLLAIVVAVIWNRVLGERSTTLSFLLDLAVAAVLGAAVLLYASGDSSVSFTRFALAAVAATGIFALYSAGSRVAEAPFIRPVALVVGGKPLGGIYVSASSNQVFVGEVCVVRPHSDDGNAATASLIDVPRASVSIMLIGDNAALPSAIQSEAALLHALAQLTALPSKQVDAVGPVSRLGRGCTDPAAADLLSR